MDAEKMKKTLLKGGAMPAQKLISPRGEFLDPALMGTPSDGGPYEGEILIAYEASGVISASVFRKGRRKGHVLCILLGPGDSWEIPCD